MNRFCRWLAMLAMAICLAPAVADEATASARPAKLRFDPQFILAEVALRMNVTLRPGIPVPAIYVESATPLRQFQDAIGPQWQLRPHVFANAYVAARNEIYLIDDAAYYARSGRTIDDSLAHEFAHYLQVMYQRSDIADPGLEAEAVAVQRAFQQHHVHPTRAAARH
jgi:hypothetical protein